MYTRTSLILFFVIMLIACTPVATVENPVVSAVVPTGVAEIRDLSPTTETVPNCSGSNTTTVKHPSYTVSTSHSVEWEVGGQAGVGLVIGEGVLLGGVQLDAAFSNTTVNGLNGNIEQSNAWDLPAEPNSIREYTIMWREVWQSGYVDVVFPNGEARRINVKYRSSIQSDIIGDKLFDCSESQQNPVANNNDNSTGNDDGLASNTQPLVTIPTATSQPIPTVGTPPQLINLAQNPSFENGMQGWEYSNDITLISGFVGQVALQSAKTANTGWGWVGISQEIPVEGGQKYTFTAYLNWMDASQLHMKVDWYDEFRVETNGPHVMGGTDGTSGQWMQRGGTAIAPADARVVRISIWHGMKNEQAVTGGVVEIDEVVFAKVP